MVQPDRKMTAVLVPTMVLRIERLVLVDHIRIEHQRDRAAIRGMAGLMGNRLRRCAIEIAAFIAEGDGERIDINDLAGEVKIRRIGVRRIAFRIGPNRIARNIAAIVAEQHLAIRADRGFGLAVRGQRLLQLIDRVDNAVVDARIDLNILFFDEVAMNDDIAEYVLIMRSAVFPLLGIGGDDRDDAVIDAIIIGVER